METLEIKQELIKRYKYLYQNKEIILSLFIEKKIQTKTYQEELKRARKTKKDAKKLKRDDLVYLLDDVISYWKKALKTPKYYLMDKIDDKSIKLIEDFLFTDDEIENTILYKMIEYLKCDEEFLKESDKKIQDIQERRINNKFIKNKEFLTVWRILTYVRNKNKENLTYLHALDKYYNIERYIKTGINWKSGYFLLDSDIIENQESIEPKEEDYDFSMDNNDHVYSELIITTTNEFEEDDDYFIFEWLNEEEIKTFQSYSTFMNGLNLIPNLTEQEKQQLYLELNPINKKLTKKI